MLEPTDKPERIEQQKPFQYSLRSLFVVTTALAVFLGVCKWCPPLPTALYVWGYFFGLGFGIEQIRRKAQRYQVRLAMWIVLILIWGALFSAVFFIALRLTFIK
jgi:hypothetical protein